LGIGDWGLGIGPIPNPQSPIPNPQQLFYSQNKIDSHFFYYILFINKYKIIYK
jgi:hypothetical protein